MKKLARLKNTSFTRNGKIDLKKLITMILRTLTKSTLLEIFSFCSKFNLKFFTKQGFSQAREKLNYRVFKELNNTFVDEYYEEDYKKYKDYILLACDGCRLSLPNQKQIKNFFGCQKNALGEANTPTAMTSELYDVENNIVLSSVISKAYTSENLMVLEHLNDISKIPNLKNKKIIILFDRGYPALELISALFINKISFIMRCKSSWLKEVNTASKYLHYDKVKEITLKLKRNKNRESVKKYYEMFGEKMFLRFVNEKFSKKEKGIFVTNLNQEEFNGKEILSLYRNRWKIETHFHTLKIKAQIENFASKTVNNIKQEYFGKILLLNLTSLLMDAVKLENPESFQNEEYEININIALGVVKAEFDDLLFGKNYEKTMLSIKEKILLIPKVLIEPNRDFERHEKIRKHRFEMNRRSAL